MGLVAFGLYMSTMPRAFFWITKDFEQHARDIGLADMPQVGVAPQGH
jgi:hypothetical protein